MIPNNNYIIIQAFMVNDLNLKGNELLVYALIYGFSQDGQSVFSGTSKYISDWIGIDKRNVLEILKRLVEKELIIKSDKVVNGIKLCDYKTSPVVMKHHRGGDETSPHIYNIDNIKIKEKIYKKENWKNSKIPL